MSQPWQEGISDSPHMNIFLTLVKHEPCEFNEKSFSCLTVRSTATDDTTFHNVGALTPCSPDPAHPCSPRFMYIIPLGGVGRSAVTANQPETCCRQVHGRESISHEDKQSRLRSHGTFSTCQQAAETTGSKGREGSAAESWPRSWLRGQGSEGRSTAGMQASREGSRQGVSSDCSRLPETGTGGRREV